MPRRSMITFLPAALREQLDEKLIASNFGGYVDLAQWLAREGHPIGKSSVHRYGAKLEKRRQVWLAPVTAQQRTDAKIKQETTRREKAKALQYTGVLVIVVDPTTRETIVYATAHSPSRTRECIEAALFNTDKSTTPKQQ